MLFRELLSSFVKVLFFKIRGFKLPSLLPLYVSYACTEVPG